MSSTIRWMRFQPPGSQLAVNSAGHLVDRVFERHRTIRRGSFTSVRELTAARSLPSNASLSLLRNSKDLPVGLPGPAACLRDPEGLRQALRQAGRRCTARRGIAEPVACRLPPHLTVCRRHRLWIGSTGQPWQAGPYGTGSRDLLARHAADLGALLAAFDELVAGSAPEVAGWSSPTVSQTRPTC